MLSLSVTICYLQTEKLYGASLLSMISPARISKNPVSSSMMKSFSPTPGILLPFLISRISSPCTKFWLTPKQMRERFKEKGWEMIINHQTRNVPHTGHEWLMKGAYLGAYGSMMVDKPRGGVLVNAMIGSKRPGG